MKLLEIKERPHLLDKFGYHLLISVFAFIAAYGFFLFGSEPEFTLYFMDHPQLKIALCGILAFLINLFTAINGFKKYHVVGIDYLEASESLKFELINRYVKKSNHVEYKLSEIYWEEKEVNLVAITTKRVVLFKHNLGKSFARIDPSYNPWSWKWREIKQAMLSLEKINLAKPKLNTLSGLS